MREVRVQEIVFSNQRPFVLIAGPCQMESEQHAFDMAGALRDIACRQDIPFVYKTSFDKANRTHVDATRGVGLEKALAIFAKLKRQLNIPILTDVHEPNQCAPVASVVDILQIPALLSRQTDLILAAARTGRVVNIKKGQFLAPWDVQSIANKVASVTSEAHTLFTERGTTFGYNNLVVDMCALPIMAEVTGGCPIIFDATHSTQKPGGLGYASGGNRRFASILARGAVAVGVAGVFMEVHQDPDHAPSDGPSMIHLEDMAGILHELKNIDLLVKNRL